MTEIQTRIQDILTQNPVVLFMKGTPSFPMCGFSQRAVMILKECGTPFHAVNILDDAEMREGIKQYGNWPTIPQLYVKNQLLGGSDIMMEMFEAGELQPLVK